jgi:hypothetical protein
VARFQERTVAHRRSNDDPHFQTAFLAAGGPIIHWDFNERMIKILGVVKGYREESAKVMLNGREAETNILVNSGILVGYSIKHAFDAIEKAGTPHTPGRTESEVKSANR